jgi:hypothetical protein
MDGDSKHNIAQSLTLSATSGTASCVIDVSNKRNMDLQLIYGAGSSTTAKLQVSNDNSHYADLLDASGTTTQITLDTSGGSHQWNVRGLESLFLKLVISGDAVSNSAILSCAG